MKKSRALVTSVACLLLLGAVPSASAQAPGAAAKLESWSQELKLTPKQKMDLLPILQEEAPKIEAIKNDASMPPMQKMRQLSAIHSENAGPLQKILTPEQYAQLQAIRKADIQKAIEAKRAAH